MIKKLTPETDSFAIKFKTPCGEKYWVPSDFSRKLEQERDEAREVAKILVDYARYYLEELKSRRHPYYQQEIESVSKNIDRVNWREGAK